jgi:putative Holliday junction resolvase
MARILCIDFGLRRTGLAWTDPLQIIATGIGFVETQVLEAELKKLMQRETISELLLGYPTRFDGSDTHATEAVRAFKARWEKLYPEVPVHLWDERLTSKMATQALFQAGVPKGKRREKGLVDQVSATMMLQEYLEHKK